MYLDIEPVFNPQLTQILDVQLPAWNDSLVEYILHLFTSQIIYDRTLNHAIYTTCSYARHLKDEEYLTHLAYLFEEGVALIHELDAHLNFITTLVMQPGEKPHFLLHTLKDLCIRNIFNFNSGNYILCSSNSKNYLVTYSTFS